MTSGSSAPANDPITVGNPGGARARRLLVWGLVLIVVGFVVGNLGSATETIGGLVMFVALGCWAWAGWIWYRFRRGLVHDVIEATGGADGKRVLLLRSFEHDDDPVLIKHLLNPLRTYRLLFTRPIGYLRMCYLTYTARTTWEQLLKAAARPIGPVIAIGEPSESMPTLGLKNEYVGDNWKERVVELIDASTVVVMRASVSESVIWEFDTVTQRVDPERLVIFVGSRSRASAERNKQRRRQFYADFCGRSAHCFPKGLPEQLGKHRSILFRSDWTPYTPPKGIRRDHPPNVRIAKYMESIL